MPSPYNDVELTEAEKGAIYENPGFKEDQNPTEQGIGQDSGFGDQPHSDEPPEKETKTVPVEVDEGVSEELGSDEFNLEDYEVEIDGYSYDGADVMKWREDSINKESWQASNTQKAQEVAQWSKLANRLSSDNEFQEYVKDYFYDDEKGLKELGLNKELRPIDVVEEEVSYEEQAPSQLDEVEERLDDMELERVVDDLESELNSIVDNNNHMFAEEGSENEFLEFVESSHMTDLQDAFKVWSYDKMQVDLDHAQKIGGNRERNQGKVVHKSEIGAQEVSNPKNYKNMRDIDIQDPDIAKYFNR